MSALVSPLTPARDGTPPTADFTLEQKTRNAAVVSGCPLVVKARI
jgi:hypothetical protein